MPEIAFVDKFIAFVDVIGFKSLVLRAEAGEEAALGDVLKILEEHGSPAHRDRFAQHGPKICPQSRHNQRNLDFRATSISDSLIVSTEVSAAGVIAIVEHCWAFALNLLQKGVMCRGYITRGTISHSEKQLVGSGYQRAYEQEGKVAAFKQEADERGTPFIEVDKEVCSYVGNHGDWCVQEMFSRLVKGDGVVTAVFPFKCLSHSFIIGDFGGHRFDPEKERKSNQNLRIWLNRLKDSVLALVDDSNPSAVRKAEHYVKALDAQLTICDKPDEMLTRLSQPFPWTRR